MISLKGDIFKDYNEENFENLLSKTSKIVSENSKFQRKKNFEFSKIY